ncbi:DUF805 domain-containing protein [Streptomyces griseorubiginosus]|uniref:DUF805 domain-containing protein n=1 Tax=Streptomyces griseorubiginosus TaxID=67304 RepID=UPI0033B6FFD5
MSWFIEVLKKYAVFSGRARRKEYWMFALFATIIYVVFLVLSIVTKQSWIVFLPILAFLLPGLAVTARRLHDTGRSGWWILFQLVPIAGPITLFVFSVLDGEPGDNKYGPNPKLAPVHV